MLQRPDKNRKKSIKTKIALTTLVTISVVLICFSGGLFYYFHNLLRDSIFKQQFVMVSEIAEQLNGRIQLARHQLSLAATEINSQVLADPDQLQQALTHISPINMIFDAGFLVIGTDGRVIAESMSLPEAEGMDLGFRDYVKVPLHNGRPFISAPFRISLPPHTPMIAMAVPVRDNDDRVICLLVGYHTLGDGQFLTSLSSKGLGNTGYLYLLQGRTILMHPDSTRVLETIPEGKNRGIDQAMKGMEGSLDNVNSTGKRVLSSFKKVGETDWILAANTPYEDAFGPLNRLVFNAVLIATGGLAFSLLVVWYVTRRLTRPIQQLITHVDGFSTVGGEWKPLELKTGDELERLANAFNGMMDEIQQAEEALKQSAETYRIVAEYTSEIAFWRTLDDSIQFISANCFDITGYRDTEFSANPDLLETLIHPDDRQLWKSHQENHSQDDTHAPVQIRIVCKDGYCRWMYYSSHLVRDSSGQVTGTRGSFSDITETILAQQKLSDEKVFVENLINSASIPMFVINSRHTVLYWNRALEIITGKAASDLKGTNLHWSGFYDAKRKTLADIVFDGDTQLDELYKTYSPSKYIEGGFQVEGWFDIGGKRRYLLFEAAPIRNSDGKIIAAIETLEDITEHKMVEMELQKTYTELKEAQLQIFQQEKMASIGQLAAGVAHEINNPMGFISSNLATLNKYIDRLTEFISVEDQVLQACNCGAKANTLAEERTRLKIDHITGDAHQLILESQDGASRVRRIVQDLTSFSRTDQSKQELVNLNESLETAINIAWNEIKYVSALNREFGDIPQILCFPQQINQVFLNLLMNAAHAMEGRQGGITVCTWSEHTDVLVSVTDTGCGIPAKIQQRIFEPFYTTKAVGKGTGLGLSISYDIIRKHCGEISLKSEPGNGTIFVVRLPVSGPPREASAAEEQ